MRNTKQSGSFLQTGSHREDAELWVELGQFWETNAISIVGKSTFLPLMIPLAGEGRSEAGRGGKERGGEEMREEERRGEREGGLSWPCGVSDYLTPLCWFIPPGIL